MLATIETFNKFHEDEGITEVSIYPRIDIICRALILAPIAAKSHELLYNGWRKRCCNSIYIESERRGCLLGSYEYAYARLFSIIYSSPQWFSSGTSFNEYAPGGFYKMFKEDKRQNIIMVASEPLTFEQGDKDRVPCFSLPVPDLLSADWMEIKTNNMIVLTPKMNVLLIPIYDKFYVHPSDPESQNRGTDFAAAKGYFTERWKVDVPETPSPDSTTPQPVQPV